MARIIWSVCRFMGVTHQTNARVSTELIQEEVELTLKIADVILHLCRVGIPNRTHSKSSIERFEITLKIADIILCVCLCHCSVTDQTNSPVSMDRIIRHS